MAEECSSGNDPVLRPVLEALSDEERDAAMASLLEEHAYWRIDSILASRFQQSRMPGDEAEDVRADVVVRLIHRIGRLFEPDQAAPIESFSDYVAVVAFNTFDDFIRRMHPARRRLKNRTRYALQHDRRLALWETNRELVCGLREWKGQPARLPMPAHVGHRVSQLRETHFADALAATLREIGAPVPLETMVTLWADALGISGPRSSIAAEGQAGSGTRSAAERIEDAQYLRTLWSEIRALPLRQRLALLLHARDAAGESMTRLLTAAGIATMHEIAETLEMSAADLARQWHELPFDDLHIASLLGLQRQQVINLRRSARDRLERRMQRP